MSHFESFKTSNLIIRWSIALIFIWFGLDKFIHPDYWINAWFPTALSRYIELIGLGQRDFMNIIGIMEVLVGVSMVTNLFIKWFAGIGLVMIVSVILVFGYSEIAIRNLAIIGGLLAILTWPSRRSI